MNKTDKIYIAGHRGMVGSAIVRKLTTDGFSNLIFKTSTELNLTNQQAVNDFFTTEQPEYVFLAAAKVGGILANNVYRADFIYQNIMIESNIIHAAHINKASKLLFLGSSCIYPKMATQPLKEEYLLTNTLEETNEPYAIAKIAGIKMCEAYRAQYNCNFISAMPTNLYGPNDNYDLKSSHVLPALIRKFHTAKENGNNSVELWGTGSPMREFLHVDDLAEACVFLMENYNEKQFVNIGTGTDITIKELALTIKKIVGFTGDLTFDTSKPDGTPRKLMDVSKIHQLGWKHKINLNEGIEKVYNKVKHIDFQTTTR
ncbi:MAG: GDP-L-fucose synthase [Flavobacteriales bacterium]|nr:GDP-L-fucose synthase [Flavobacteriales bacterium]NQX98808.1 GDP-L-fucose synthase [Flavobacteriales bacterium]